MFVRSSRVSFKIYFTILMVAGCSTSTMDGNDGSIDDMPVSTGGATASGGGTSDGTGGENSTLLAVPRGPGLVYDADIGPACPAWECQLGKSGTYEVESRCDTSGIWEHPTCQEAKYSWQTGAVSGTIDYSGVSSVDISAEVTWEVEVPMSCGGCEEAQRTLEGIEGATCSEDGSVCRCSADGVMKLAYEGTKTTREGAGVIIELPTFENIDRELMTWTLETCFDGTDRMVVWDHWGGNYVTRLVEP